MANFKTSMTTEDILDEMNKSEGNAEVMHAGPCFLNYKLQKSLLEQQNDYNGRQLFWTRLLVLGTWALVIATIAISRTSTIWPK